MEILNLYAGIGGNRKLWGDEHEITAVEYNEDIANIYKKFYPNDTVLVEDAHEYLLNNYQDYDFIWSSPPCPTHSVTNNFLHAQGVRRYPDMSLWQEIILLKKWFKGKWVVENVTTYYEPFYMPMVLDRHYFWSNFEITPLKIYRDFNIANAKACSRQSPEENMKSLSDYHGIYLDKNVKNARKLLRNCVNPKLGKHIFDCMLKSLEVKQQDKLI